MDYYSILGVPKNASEADLKKAYKKASMQHHPDRGGDEAKFKQINEAYSTLKDPAKRQQYDNPQPQFNFNSRDFTHGQNPFAGSPFEDLFRQPGQSRTPRNKDIRLAATIDLKDVLTGKSLVMQYKLNSGRLETVTVEIPPGAKHGDTIKFHELGDDGHPRYPRGDLDVRIKVSKQRNWERDNNNLITKKSVNIIDLLLGCAIIVNTLDEKQVKLKIPKGTQPGQIFSITGYGVPDINTGRRGNLYVNISAEMPIINDPKIIEQLENIKNTINGT